MIRSCFDICCSYQPLIVYSGIKLDWIKWYIWLSVGMNHDSEIKSKSAVIAQTKLAQKAKQKESGCAQALQFASKYIRNLLRRFTHSYHLDDLPDTTVVDTFNNDYFVSVTTIISLCEVHFSKDIKAVQDSIVLQFISINYSFPADQAPFWQCQNHHHFLRFRQSQIHISMLLLFKDFYMVGTMIHLLNIEC